MKTLKLNLLLSLALSLISVQTFATIGREGGGGSGCLAQFMHSAYETGQWLQSNGSSLHPVVSAGAFLLAIDPDQIKETTQDLQYHGNPVDAYFDGTNITIRCDRLASDSDENRRRVIAHEIFRKMGLEGDGYEISRQINYSAKAVTHSTCIANIDFEDTTMNAIAVVKCDGQKAETTSYDMDFSGPQNEIDSFRSDVDAVIAKYARRGYKVVSSTGDINDIHREIIFER